MSLRYTPVVFVPGFLIQPLCDDALVLLYLGGFPPQILNVTLVHRSLVSCESANVNSSPGLTLSYIYFNSLKKYLREKDIDSEKRKIRYG
ncbi:MAG: hypothetical protein AOA65_0643 [Candidatus Bathyarchaeota archaeon BA1]|nr:MAG: hypothetical protein AOA65_0643 [Candidatus Bathyarchaeota archaeon BA1]